MSGEYFCIEEVDPAVYYEGIERKKMGDNVFNVRQEFDSQSTTSKQSQDLRLHEIEEQLEVAESRCNKLKVQLDSMKKIYHKTTKTDYPPQPKRTDISPVTRIKEPPTSFSPRNRVSSPPPAALRSRLYSSSKNDFHESTDTNPPMSSATSTGAPFKVTRSPTSTPAQSIMVPLVRQNSSFVGTDTSGAAVRTINNILTGITDSVNRLSQLHAHDYNGKKSKKKPKDTFCGTNDVGTVFSVPTKSFSPRMEKRIAEQQRRVDEIAKSLLEPVESCVPQKSASSFVKAKHSAHGWSKHTHVKTFTPKTKIQSSSGSVNLAKNLKSTAKHVDNTTKLHTVKSSMVDEESGSLVMSRKRKRPVKRLKPLSKMTLGRRATDQANAKQCNRLTSDNLVELYHNVAATESDSDDGNDNKLTELTRQKGGGDLPVLTVHLEPASSYDEATQYKPLSKMIPTSRILAPINEHGLAEAEEQLSKTFSGVGKNYELPTIASKMKQVTKCYLQAFNFRCIPFCAAKSISPSHNIGINIQQVMSIIKTRQPISGISPTLAHNISLAAGKLQSRPFSTFVSTLGSKIGYGRSQCPMSKHPLNFNHLQELARDVQEDAYNDQLGYAGGASIEDAAAHDVFVKGPSGDTQEHEEMVWSMDPSQQPRCTCSRQNGLSFEQVISKYQMASEAPSVHPKPSTVGRAHRIPLHKQTKTTVNPGIKKQRTKNWIRNDGVHSRASTTKQPQISNLQGKERNLKTVLKNLHDEFDSLNNKYESFAKELGKDDVEPDVESAKKLEQMECALNKKEEEINMVMSLYTEVLALKDQVKKLRERTSLVSLLSQNTPKTPESREPRAALHLTQLLRQIQNYQMHCKNAA